MNETWVTAAGGEMPSMVTHFGRVCVMVCERVTGRWTYIPERKWLRMTDTQRARYSA